MTDPLTAEERETLDAVWLSDGDDGDWLEDEVYPTVARLIELRLAPYKARLAEAWDEGCSHAGGPDVVPCPQNPYRDG